MCPFASFGDFVRSQTPDLSRGPTLTRTELQDLGQQLVTKDPVAFCRSVLLSGGFEPDRPLVLDGLRHLALLPVLSSIIAGPLKIIYVEAAHDLRISRWEDKITEAALLSVDSHAVEADLGGIREIADLVVNTEIGAEAAFCGLIDWITGLYPDLGTGPPSDDLPAHSRSAES
jgi:hypothetical protein